MSGTAKQIAAILLLSGVVAVVANTLHPRKIPYVQAWSNHVEARARKAGINVIPLSVAFEWHRDGTAWFVDARPAAEFHLGHVSGARSVPVAVVHEAPEELFQLTELGRPLVVYCRDRSCDEALLLATELAEMGVTNLALFIDGFLVWEKYGGPVER